MIIITRPRLSPPPTQIAQRVRASLAPAPAPPPPLLFGPRLRRADTHCLCVRMYVCACVCVCARAVRAKKTRLLDRERFGACTAVSKYVRASLRTHARTHNHASLCRRRRLLAGRLSLSVLAAINYGPPREQALPPLVSLATRTLVGCVVARTPVAIAKQK